MKKNKIINKVEVVILICIAIITLSSCEKWLDINHDPNSPESTTPQLVLPVAEASLVAQVNSHYNIAGGIWSQFWAQNNTSGQYKVYDSYNITSSTLDIQYQEMYPGAINDLQYIINKSLEDGDIRYYLIANCLQIYSYQLMADLYDQIPFNEALQGIQNLQPRFDQGTLVYDSLISRLNRVIELTDRTLEIPEKYQSYMIEDGADFIFKGNILKWRQFANTLKLKLYLRQIHVRPDIAENGIKKMFTDNVEFLEEDAAMTVFVNQPTKTNPLYEVDQLSLNTTNNLLLSYTFSKWLKDNGDTRIDKLFIPGKSGHAGMIQGNYLASINEINPANLSKARILSNDPAYLYSKAECYFLLSEAALRYGVDDPQKYYDKGVLAAFSRLKLDGSSFITGVYAFPATADTETKLEKIIVQKWASQAGINGIEAYSDHLRTGYPKRTSLSASGPAYVGGTFTHPVASVIPYPGYPKRLLFPDSEKIRNKNTPAEVPVTTGVWWNNK